MKLLMLKGLPGSGKSTWARQFIADNRGWVRVNKDTLRSMIVYHRKDEDLICQFRDTIIIHAFIDKKNVIVDDTNFHPKHERALRSIADAHGAEFEVKVFDTPIEDCIKNDLKRPESVGERVIRQMHEQYIRPVIRAKYPQDITLPKAIICDLDGTLAHAGHRNVYDASTCDDDDIDPVVQDILFRYADAGHKILFTSGRDEAYRPQTKIFLLRAGMDDYELFMRPYGDRRKDHVIKLELFERNIYGRYNVEFVLDDRQRVVDMWRDVGLKVLQVEEGNF